ncbi:hypothetical protein H0O02_01425 [Candidatus Micrarchaeota archaeon]|nr:hypothetical protein [Candidatus Micrarchaeota archaeon]
MKEAYATLDQTSYEFKEKYENIELVVCSILAFTIPLLFPQPQLLTGTLVNAFLIMAALHFRGWKVLPLVMLPSMAAVLNGVLFGPFTVSLLYMMPFIWLGNFALVYLFKRLHIANKTDYFLALGVSALAKAGLLFGVAYLLVEAGILPTMFLTAMGLLQLGTAITGGIVAFGMRSAYVHLLK